MRPQKLMRPFGSLEGDLTTWSTVPVSLKHLELKRQTLRVRRGGFGGRAGSFPLLDVAVGRSRLLTSGGRRC